MPWLYLHIGVSPYTLDTFRSLRCSSRAAYVFQVQHHYTIALPRTLYQVGYRVGYLNPTPLPGPVQPLASIGSKAAMQSSVIALENAVQRIS